MHVSVAKVAGDGVRLDHRQPLLAQNILDDQRAMTVVREGAELIERRIGARKDADVHDPHVVEDAIGGAHHEALGLQGPPGDADARRDVVKVLVVSRPRNAIGAGANELAVRVRGTGHGPGAEVGHAEAIVGLHRRGVVLVPQPHVQQQARRHPDIVLDVGAHPRAAQTVEGVALDREGVVGRSGHKLHQRHHRVSAHAALEDPLAPRQKIEVVVDLNPAQVGPELELVTAMGPSQVVGEVQRGVMPILRVIDGLSDPVEAEQADVGIPQVDLVGEHGGEAQLLVQVGSVMLLQGAGPLRMCVQPNPAFWPRFSTKSP